MNRRTRWLAALFLFFAVCPTKAKLLPRIVNGVTTDAYPAVGFVALYDDVGQTQLSGLCSGTLIGCRTVVTAAHCVCPENADTYESCAAEGVADPRTVAVFLPHVGVLQVESVTVHPEYEFGRAQDVAVLRLAGEADGVPPLPLATVLPALGQAGEAVGYGTTRGGARSVNDTGIKRQGSIVIGSCPEGVSAEANVCWTFLGTGGNTCWGDSGGAVIALEHLEPHLAGVVSGGSTEDCGPPDQSFATAIAAARDWIVAQANSDVGHLCEEHGYVGDGVTATETYLVALGSDTPYVEQTFEVPPDAAELRVTFNGQTESGRGFSATGNDFDLFLAPVALPSGTGWLCTDERPENWGACRIERPAPGAWQVELHRLRGNGQAQLTVTLFRAGRACAGDCNGEGGVTVDEIVTAVGILLGTVAPEECTAADINHDGQLTVDEIVTAVNAALNGCA